MNTNRRDVLKGLTTVAGGMLLPSSARQMFAQGPSQKQAQLAIPIRGLVSRGGKLLQPIQITLSDTTRGVVAVTKLNGTEADRRVLGGGPQTFQVFTEPVAAPQDITVTVTVGETSNSTSVKLQPVRKMTVYLLPHSHHDLGYTDIQSNIEEKQIHNITLGIEAARKTASYREGARFVWNLEVLWGADLFMRRKSQAERDEFIDAVKKGWIGVNGMYANELTGLCRPEELLQLFRYGVDLGRKCGMAVNAAMMSDVPGYTWGTITAMSQAGIRYFSIAPNWFDRIGRLMAEWQDKPFWHISRSGNEQVLVWIPWTGYALSHGEKVMSVDLVAKYQDRLDAVSFPYDISYIRWSGHGDNAEPDPQICEFIQSWSENYEWPKFVISSTSTAFAAFERRHGADLPKLRGDLTPYWEDGAGSSALETAINRNAVDRLSQAEALAAMLPVESRRVMDFNEAWRNALLFSEHTWGAAGSISNPEAEMTKKQWEGKRLYALDASKQAKELLDQTIGAGISGDRSSIIDVHNSTSWARSELVLLSKEMSAAGDRVKDHRGKLVASQRLSTGELAFMAHDVPPFGAARFSLSAGKPHALATPVSIQDGQLDNGILRVRVDAATGNIVEVSQRGIPGNLVDTSAGEAANEYIFLEGSDLSKLEYNGPASITIEETGPLVASLRIESTAPGCRSLVRRLRLAAGADWIEISNLVDKTRAPLEPQPEGHKPSQQVVKESVQFAFPFAVPEGKMHIDIPLAEMQPEIDQLPGACKNWLPVGRWVDVSNAHRGVTWVTLDAPLIEAGAISANLLGSQRNTKVWRDHIAPTQKFYSWVMNNHWGTNYRAYQEGPVEFRYALRAHNGYNPAAASRLAIGLSQPLIASVAHSGPVQEPLLRIEPEDVLALTLKPSEDGKARIVRLFGASGEDRTATLHWAGATPPSQHLSDLSERAIQPLAGSVSVSAWDVVTVRAEQA